MALLINIIMLYYFTIWFYEKNKIKYDDHNNFNYINNNNNTTDLEKESFEKSSPFTSPRSLNYNSFIDEAQSSEIPKMINSKFMAIIILISFGFMLTTLLLKFPG